MKNHLLTFATLVLLLISSTSFAQTTKGTIRGTIKDAANGEELIGATVVIVGTTNGSAADLDGKYSISVEAGTYDLQISFVSYQTKTVTGVEVKAGQVTVIDATLGEDTEMLEAVVIEAKAETASTTAVLAAQKNSGVVQDGLAAEQIARSGDRDAAAAITRVTGVSVEGGKYVYVRGLGDRYSQTTLNGASLPSLDPNRNSVQMDLFPSNLIDNIIVSKTFSPDLSGSFAGGNINVVTKDFPDRFTFQWNSSLGFNDQTSLNNNFLTHKGGKTDFLGIDDGSRSIPSGISNEFLDPRSFLTPEQKQQVDNQTKSFGTNMDYERKAPFLNQFHSLSLGNQINVLGRPFGFVSSLSYQRNFSYYDNGVTGRFSRDGVDVIQLNPTYQLNTEQGTESALWGANLNMSYKVAPTSKISLNLMYNRSGDKTTDYRSGLWNRGGAGLEEGYVYRTQTMQFLERGIASAQLKGKHTVGKRNIEIEWLSSLAQSTQNEPDLRYFSDDYYENGGERFYDIAISSYNSPARYYRDMNEINWDNKVDITIPFTSKGGDSKFKFGGGYLMKDRDFNEKRYQYINFKNSGVLDNYRQTGTIDDFFQNVGVMDNGNLGVVITDFTSPRNSYTGYQEIISFYGMTDWRFTKKFRAVMGVRYEGTNLQAASDDETLNKANIQENDFLPALNLIYELNKSTNLRASYGRTLARPTFRELAPFPSFAFADDFTIIGNENLERTLIDNFDLRYEMYPNAGEIISVSAFYKKFSNPIERAFDPREPNGQIQYKNVDQAFVAGLELEVRKRLDFSDALKNFSVGANFSLMYSEVDIDSAEYSFILKTDPNREPTRTMFMQSPYVLNSFIYYDLPEKGLSISGNFNVFGKRLAIVAQAGQPDVYEVPRPSLDFAVKKTMESGWGFSFRARNLLNPEYKQVQDFQGTEYIYDSYTVGRTFSLGVTYLID
ncbi:TonB-dependent receptor [Bernardetia sp. Wsw4-3y2]|uniref:TonB-dependent receptor n=1 Tax=unclassified Bernardetia TaxID=2647129 RepID=UPI0030D0EC9C